MTLKITDFTGIAPVIAPHKLNPLAQTAKNVQLFRGQLEAMRGNEHIKDASIYDIKSFARYQPESTAYWFEFSHVTDMVPSQIFGSARSEMYWTDGIKPKRTTSSIATESAPYPSASFSLGVPAPEGQIIADQITGDAPDTDFDLESRVYVVTFVTEEGYEGSSSLPVTIELGKRQGCTLSNLPTSDSGNHNVVKKRIYRGNAAAASLFFLDEIDLNKNVYKDELFPENLGESMSTLDYDLPPDDMIGLTVMPNGVLAGFNDNQICFSEPFVPYAWPLSYRLTTEKPIVAIAPIGSGLLITTTGKPYLAVGTSPGSIILQQMDSNQSCVSKRSMVDVGNSALYASPDGLVEGNSSGVQLIGNNLFSREQWQALKPESIHAYYHDEKYIFFYDNGVTKGGFIFSPKTQTNALTEIGFYADNGYNDLQTDTLYLLKDRKIVAFQHGDLETYVWRSAKIELPNLIPYSVCRVIAETYPAEITIIQGDHEVSVTYHDDQPFRISTSARARFVEIELRGNNAVKEVLLGNDMVAVYG